jgi:hypothetical protein
MGPDPAALWVPYAVQFSDGLIWLTINEAVNCEVSTAQAALNLLQVALAG